MRARAVLALVTAVPFALLAGACELEPDDPKLTTCEKLDQLCGRSSYSSEAACSAAFDSTEECRLSCAAAQDDCDSIDACLYPAVGSGGLVDTWCSDSSSSDSGGGGTDGTTGPGPSDQEGGVCYFQYSDAGISGFGCQAGIDSRDACEAWVLERTEAGANVVQWDWLVECASVGCQTGCGPSWWSLF